MQPSLRLIQWYCQKEGFRSCLRHTRATKHTRSIETSPGFEVQIDFGEKTVSVNSEPTTIHFFTACQASFKLPPPPKKIKSTTSTHDTIVNLSGKVSLRLPWKKVIALDIPRELMKSNIRKDLKSDVLDYWLFCNLINGFIKLIGTISISFFPEICPKFTAVALFKWLNEVYSHVLKSFRKHSNTRIVLGCNLS